MAEGAGQQGVMPSILDRLIDPDSSGTDWRHGYSIEQLQAVVCRDLQELLNTRQSFTALPRGLERLANSVYAFGLPDLTSFNAITPNQRDEIARALEETIRRFEPRLSDVRATLLGSEDDTKLRAIRFRIEARVGVDPAPEVSFETVLHLSTGEHSVRPS
jgi:type VI secretion system protein ImpF